MSRKYSLEEMAEWLGVSLDPKTAPLKPTPLKPNAAQFPHHIGEAETVDDLDDLCLPARILNTITMGHEQFGDKVFESPSEARFAVIIAMHRAGLRDETILGVLTDDRFEISRRGNGKQLTGDEACKDIERAHAKNLSPDPADDFNEPVDPRWLPTEAELEATKERKELKSVVYNPTPFVYVEPALMPPRAWVYKPAYIKKYLSLTVAAGGVGKSNVVMVEAAAIASGKALLGIEPQHRARVWVWNGEDPIEEIDKRFAAITMQHSLEPSDLEGWLFKDSGRDIPIKLARLGKNGVKIAVPVVDALVAALVKNKIEVLIIDPYVRSHDVTENDSMMMDDVAEQWAIIAERANCSIMLVHHTRKTGGNAGTIEDSRGASALINAARVRRAVNKMTVQQAEAAKLDVERRGFYISVDYSNSTHTPPASSLTWYELKSVELGNKIDDLDGDNMGVAVLFEYSVAATDLMISDEQRAALLAALKGKNWRTSDQSPDWIGFQIAATVALSPMKGKEGKNNRASVAKLVDDWANRGVLKVVEAEDSRRKIKPHYVVADDVEDQFAPP